MARTVLLMAVAAMPGLGARIGHRRVRQDSCSSIGCDASYNASLACQCNNRCREFGNCCDDYFACEGSCSEIGCGVFDSANPCQCNSGCTNFGDCCDDYSEACEGGGSPNPSPSPSPSPSPVPAPTPLGGNASQYWQAVDLSSLSAIQSRLKNGASRMSYTPGIWDFYKDAWVNLPGGCQGGLLDIYSARCWTPGTGQCGSAGYRGEGECYNREHSWPKSWWGGSTSGDAHNDIHHIFPSDGYVNQMRSSYVFGEVSSATWTSSEGHKRGSCSTGTCFEPLDRVKGLLARANLYMAVRYRNEFSCCSNDAVNGADLTTYSRNLLLKWSGEHPPAAWETEFNNRAQAAQGNRNPFIDFPDLADQLFR